MLDEEQDAELRNPFPAPPSLYTNYTDHNLALLALLKSRIDEQRIGGSNDERRWIAADRSRDVQDEYLEWSLIRDGADKIVRVTFTCEGPEVC